jgi:hypothetical protein
MRPLHLPAAFTFLLALPLLCPADDAPLVRLTFQPETPDGRLGDEQTTEGKVANELPDGSLVLLDRGGRLWPVTRDRIKSREETGQTFAPYSQQEMVAALKSELGDGFEIVTTKHYVLCSEASREYARWTGSLFERLMAAFDRRWDTRPLKLHEPDFPLCAIILRDETRFGEFALADAGPGVIGALGYYSTLSNRMVMYDLTAGLSGRAPQTPQEVVRRLAGQVSNVSTIVHEATHQIAFNSGMHTRMADNPFWLVEGMAMYFETPDLSNANGWRTVGKVNAVRLRDYQEYRTTRREAASLKTIVTADERFHAADTATAVDAYAEAWALTYYLINRERAAYQAYLAKVAQKKPLEQDEPEKRLAEFEDAFGKLADVERDMAKYMATLKAR